MGGLDWWHQGGSQWTPDRSCSAIHWNISPGLKGRPHQCGPAFVFHLFFFLCIIHLATGKTCKEIHMHRVKIGLISACVINLWLWDWKYKWFHSNLSLEDPFLNSYLCVTRVCGRLGSLPDPVLVSRGPMPIAHADAFTPLCNFYKQIFNSLYPSGLLKRRRKRETSCTSSRATGMPLLNTQRQLVSYPCI